MELLNIQNRPKSSASQKHGVSGLPLKSHGTWRHLLFLQSALIMSSSEHGWACCWAGEKFTPEFFLVYLAHIKIPKDEIFLLEGVAPQASIQTSVTRWQCTNIPKQPPRNDPSLHLLNRTEVGELPGALTGRHCFPGVWANFIENTAIYSHFSCQFITIWRTSIYPSGLLFNIHRITQETFEYSKPISANGF